MSDYKNFETQAIRTQVPHSDQMEHSVPIYATSSFVFENAEHARALFAEEEKGNIYSRYSNPNNDEFIKKLCMMEGCEDGMGMASGMAAMFVSMAAFLGQGDHLLVSRSIFGSTHQIITQMFPKWGISYTYVDINKPQEWEKAIKPNTKMIFAETPSNPGLDIIDLEFLGNLAESHNLILNIDNCFATPYVQTPAKYGAHLVTHSATKFIDGQGRVIAGAVLGTKELMEKVRFFARHTGPAMSPFNGWILSKSLETLAVRMEKHCHNAFELAKYLEGNNYINWVKYPFLKSYRRYELAIKQMRLGGGLVTFEIGGGIERGRKFMDNLKMISLSANLGDTRSIATHPASTTHSKLSPDDRKAVSITDGLIRISVGLEHIEDIIEDIDQALTASF